MSNWRVLRWAIVYGLAVVVVVALFAAVKPPRAPLEEVYTPRFPDLARPEAPGRTVVYMIGELSTPRGLQFLDAITPSESGAVWLALIVALVVGFDFVRPASARNVDLLLLLVPGLLLFHALDFLGLLHIRPYITLLDWVFSAVFLASLALIVRAVWRSGHPLRSAWEPGLALRPLVTLAVVLLSLDIVIALVRPVEDSGFYINLGAQRLRERGHLPYGDPLLDGNPGAAYGPVVYVAHVPFQWLIDPWTSNAESPDLPELGEHSKYLAPSELATKACTIAFHLLGVVALWITARRLSGDRVACGLVALYCGSAAVLGVGGDRDMLTGMSFVSHIAPASTVLAAFALLPRTFWAGAVLGLGAGVGFYPAFMAPAWAGHFWSDKRALGRFLAGFVVSGLVVGVMVLALSRPGHEGSVIATFFRDAFGHHTDPIRYGHSPFGFWGQKGPVRTWFMRPLVDGSAFTGPAFLIFLVFVPAMFFVTRRRGVQALALASAAVAIGATLLKIHSTGTYLAWSYPLLLLGHFAWSPGESTRPD